MTDSKEKLSNPYAVDDDDTAETSLAGRFFLWRWYRRTTLGFGRSRGFFMPLGFMALSAMAFYYGFDSFRQLLYILEKLIHDLMVFGASLLGQNAQQKATYLLDLRSRHATVPVLSIIWSAFVCLWLAVVALPCEEDNDDLGYVLPGSGFFARAWGVVGKRIYQIKQAVKYMFAYLRDLNIQKIYLPVTIPALMVLAFAGLSLALDNILFEIPVHIESMRQSVSWITPCSRIIALIVVLVLGIPMLVNSIVRIHKKSVKLRKEGCGFFRRRLKGVWGVVFVFVPVGWMIIQLLAGAFA